MRTFLITAGAAGLAALLVWGLSGLPPFGSYPGPYGEVLNSFAVGERKATDVVSAVNFDYRAFDTMGEEFILFTAVIGTLVLLRELRREVEEGDAETEERPSSRGLTSTALTTLKISVLAPMPSAKVMTATKVNPGLLISVRKPCRRSCQRLCTCTLPLQSHSYLSATNGSTFVARRAGM